MTDYHVWHPWALFENMRYWVWNMLFCGFDYLHIMIIIIMIIITLFKAKYLKTHVRSDQCKDDLQLVKIWKGKAMMELKKWKLQPTNVKVDCNFELWTFLNIWNKDVWFYGALWRVVTVLVCLFNVGTSMPLRKKHWESSKETLGWYRRWKTWWWRWMWSWLLMLMIEQINGNTKTAISIFFT